MIQFDPSYSRDIFSEIMPVSAFGPERKEGQADKFLLSDFGNLNIYITYKVGHTIIPKLRAKPKATEEIHSYHDTPPIRMSHSPFVAGGFSSELGTNLEFFQIDFESLVISEKAAKVKATKEIHSSYASRIEFLQEEAIMEGVTFNKESEQDFWTFVESIPFLRRGSLFLMDNGDLRVVWDDDEDDLVGLQFLGNSSARYVIFKRRAEKVPVSRVAGTDTLKGVNAQIQAFKLETLLSA